MRHNPTLDLLRAQRIVDDPLPQRDQLAVFGNAIAAGKGKAFLWRTLVTARRICTDCRLDCEVHWQRAGRARGTRGRSFPSHLFASLGDN